MRPTTACLESAATPKQPLPTKTSLPPILSPHTSNEHIYLVDLYFIFLHDKPHTLFHEPTFKASVAEGTVSQPVLLAMMGMSARFATQPDIVARGVVYRKKACAALKEDLENICIENVQACILVGNNFFGDGDADAESLYFGLASRMTQILNLGSYDETDDGVTREVKRRIFWTCFIIDTWASGGSNLSRQFKWQANQPRAPMDEYVFFNMKKGDADIDDSEWKPGLWAYMVKLVEIYTQIQHLHQDLADTVDWDESSIEATVQRLEAELGAFEETVGPGLMFTRENLEVFVNRGLGRVFVAFHLGYHHYYTLLFYHYLDHRRPPTRNGKKYADSCKAHASTVCDILKASREVPGAEALYNIVGHVTIVSSSVLLHTYLFGESHEFEDSRERLGSNLESLVQLRSYWPSVERMIGRLVVFQKHCMRSMNTESYRFDKWMVKFLIAHALELEDKVDDSWDGSNAGSTGGDVNLERGRITQAMIMDIQN
ncbi:Zn2-C6 fungal-type domain-containing protein [Fusarium acuminatum]|uniref:Zn2-C6 fungal-type domain-containing protein n=1 Tax=Fusarium acuminatum TaxID=5515 RepID=A0ABZ2X5G7_9HYPO